MPPYAPRGPSSRIDMTNTKPFETSDLMVQCERNPYFGDTLFGLRWSMGLINSYHNRKLLVSALRIAVILLNGHCSFVSRTHFKLDGSPLAEKITSAPTKWKNFVEQP